MNAIVKLHRNQNREAGTSGAQRILPKDLRAKTRVELQEVVPLDTPFVVYIDPTNKCNFRCEFCPTGDDDLLRAVGRKKEILSFELFKKVVDDLRRFPRKLKLASIYKDGEPLLHKQFPEMIRYLRDANVTERIWTKTNGSRLSPELNARLADCGLDLMTISVEAVTSEGFQKIARAKVDYEKFLANVADLYQRRGKMEIYVKIADSGLSEAELDKFYRDFEPICTHIGVEKLMGWSYSDLKDFTLGTNPDTYDGAPLIPKNICAYPLYVLAVNSDGSVSLCGNDWAHGTAVGNVKEQSLLDIWHGEALFQFRKTMLEGRRCDIDACAKCYYIQIVPDNIDQHGQQILGQLAAARNRAPAAPAAAAHAPVLVPAN